MGSLLQSPGIQPPTWKKQINLSGSVGAIQLPCQRWPLPDDAEHVDVCVVSREVNEDHSGPSGQPQVVHQVCQYGGALLFGPTQVLIVSGSTVCCQQAPVRGTLDLFLCVVGPAAETGSRSPNCALRVTLYGKQRKTYAVPLMSPKLKSSSFFSS